MFAFALGLCSAVSALENMGYELGAPKLMDWLTTDTDATYPVYVTAKVALKPELANEDGKAQLKNLLKVVQRETNLEKGCQQYTFRSDLWDQYSFWSDEMWATKADLLNHAGPHGALGRAMANFTSLSTIQLAIFKDVSPFRTLRMLDLESSGGDELPAQAPLLREYPLASLSGEHRRLRNDDAEFISGITSGTCESHGLKAITSHDECVKATAGSGFPVSDVTETTTPAGCWRVEGKAEICFNTLTTAQTPVACSKMFPCYCRSQERCWDYPEAGTERCSVAPMNVLPTGARVTHLFKDNDNLDEPVVAVSKWTLLDDKAWRRNLWINTMRGSATSAKREKGLKVFKWGSDVFDENTFWAYQVWESKREYIAYCTTGAYSKWEWYLKLQTSMEVSLFSGDYAVGAPRASWL